MGTHAVTDFNSTFTMEGVAPLPRSPAGSDSSTAGTAETDSHTETQTVLNSSYTLDKPTVLSEKPEPQEPKPYEESQISEGHNHSETAGPAENQENGSCENMAGHKTSHITLDTTITLEPASTSFGKFYSL